MKYIDFSWMGADQLEQKLYEFKKEQFNLRFQKSTSQLGKSSRVREVRRDIARIKTLVRSKAIEGKK